MREASIYTADMSDAERNRPYQITGSKLDAPEWAQAIGRAVIAFGNIEHALDAVSGVMASEPIREWLKKYPLEARLGFLHALLQSAELTAEESERWNRVYGEIQRLREDYRNALVHGAPGTYIEFVDEERIEFGVRHSTHRNPKKVLTLEQVQEVVERAEAAHMEIAQVGTQIATRLVSEDRLPILSRARF
jgi:hypothetical protein